MNLIYLVRINLFHGCRRTRWFIQCIHDVFNKKQLNINDINGITLISDDKKILYWNVNILKNRKNNIQYGKDKTGDIYKLYNSLDYIKSHKQKCYLVTSDGGFDFQIIIMNKKIIV